MLHRNKPTRAASVLTLVGGIAELGPPLTESSYSQLRASYYLRYRLQLYLLGAATFRSQSSSQDASSEISVNSAVSDSFTSKFRIDFWYWYRYNIRFRLLMDTFAKILKTQMLECGTMMGRILALALAIPAGEIAVQIGNRRAMLIGLTWQ